MLKLYFSTGSSIMKITFLFMRTIIIARLLIQSLINSVEKKLRLIYGRTIQVIERHPSLPFFGKGNFKVPEMNTLSITKKSNKYPGILKLNSIFIT